MSFARDKAGGDRYCGGCVGWVLWVLPVWRSCVLEGISGGVQAR